MSSDRTREDAAVAKIVERVLKSDALLDKIGSIVATKITVCIKEYEEKVKTLESKLVEAYDEIDSLQQYSRLNSLRVYGVPETSNENTDNKIISLCKEKLSIDVLPSSIDCSHRLGKSENGTRPILIKFANRNVKREIYQNKKKFKGTKIVVREDLTKRRVALMKDVKKKCGIAWTNGCRIFTKVNDEIRCINNYEDLKQLSTDIEL